MRTIGAEWSWNASVADDDDISEMPIFIAWNERRKPFVLRDIVGYLKWLPRLSHFFSRSVFYRAEREREESGSVQLKNFFISIYLFNFVRNERTNKLFCKYNQIRMHRFGCLCRWRQYFSCLSIFVIFWFLCAHCGTATAINGSINRFISFASLSAFSKRIIKNIFRVFFAPDDETQWHAKIDEHEPILHRVSVRINYSRVLFFFFFVLDCRAFIATRSPIARLGTDHTCGVEQFN